MRIVELIIDEEAEMYGIDAISIVDRPAIELDFIALKEARLQFAETDTDKRILMGPALVPTSLSTAGTERTSSMSTSPRAPSGKPASYTSSTATKPTTPSSTSTKSTASRWWSRG
jgi:hypothetical protein